MAKNTTIPGKITLADARKERLKAALKANLKRRKAQSRVRKSTPPGPGATED